MVKTIVWSNNAQEDLRKILSYWFETENNLEYCRKLADMFFDITNLISQFPQIGKQVEGKKYSINQKVLFHLLSGR